MHPAVSRYMCRADGLHFGSQPTETLNQSVRHIICGDAVDVLRRLPPDCVDLVHSSPPYNISRPYQSSADDNTSAKAYEDFLEATINELKRVLRPGGSVFWQTGYTQNGGSLGEIVPIDIMSYRIFHGGANPFLLWDRIIWRYWGGHAFTRKFTNKHESILWFVKPGGQPKFAVDSVREQAKEYDKRNNFWGRNPGNVWEVDRVAFGSTEQTSHIAVFPEEITERIVRACSEPGDLVLDPFAGSGTVPKVAQGLGRRWFGIEISPLYAREAAVRVGFQQPGESDSLAAELVKRLAFHGRRGTLNISQVSERLQLWLYQASIGEQLEAFESDVASVFDDGTGRNHTKRNVWTKYDARLGEAHSGDPVAQADQMLCRCYKLRRRFNGVTRFKSALTALGAVSLNVATMDQANSYIARIASQEPSSFEIDHDALTFVSPTRRITTQVANSEEYVPADGAPPPVEESHQPRLAL